MKTKVLILSNSYAGESRLMNLFVTSLDVKEYEVLVCYLKGKSDKPDTLDKMGISRYLLTKRGKPNFETITKLGVLLKEFKPDIIHCHRFDSTVVGIIASRIYKLGKVVAHVHGLNRVRGLRRRIIARTFFKNLAMTVCVSDHVRDDIVGMNSFLEPDKVKVLHNAVDIDLVSHGEEARKFAKKKLNLSSDTFNIVNLGRLVPTKGQVFLIDAFARALKSNDKLRLYFIGEGRLKWELTEQIDRLGISDKVHFVGYRTDVLELLCGFDLFAFSSLAEGLALSLVEAMAAGLPVLTTSAGGLPEVFGDGGFGEMVEIGSSDALLVALEKITSLSEDELKVLGAKARERAIEGFSSPVLKNNLEKIYKDVLKG